MAKEIVTIIIDEYGSDEFLRRVSDPFWFQALGCVLGYDWHSSGVTTVVTGILKQAISSQRHGIAVCGGKGRASRKAPMEIGTVGEEFGFSDDNVEALRRASRMSAKVDNTAVQAGYQLYQHYKNVDNTPFLNYLAHLEQTHTRKAQQRHTDYILTRLNKNTNLNNPAEVEQYIASLNNTNAYKASLTQVYKQYCNYQQITYKPKKYDRTNKPIHIPTEERINMIIAESGKTLATKLTLSKETGLRPVEVHTLKTKDIDLQQHLVYPTTAKHGAPRILRISEQLTQLLLAHIIRNKLNQNDQLFKGTEEHYGTAFQRTRNRLANKINDPTLRTIRLYDLRHYFATMLYHKTHDILLVKQQLGHKYIEYTLIYIDLEATLFNVTDEYTSKISHNEAEAILYSDTGFTYITDIGTNKLWRKRK